MKSVAVFCASANGINPVYRSIARQTGSILARRGCDVVYGGARVGLMGEVADGALDAGGWVVGVLPEFLRDRELAHTGISEMIFVKSMHDRKRILQERSDAILTLPGGFGTMEEFFELLTWSQLGLHSKPIGILNVNGVYDHLIQLFDTLEAEGFIRTKNRDLVLVDSDLERLLDAMERYQAPERTVIIDERTI